MAAHWIHQTGIAPRDNYRKKIKGTVDDATRTDGLRLTLGRPLHWELEPQYDLDPFSFA